MPQRPEFPDDAPDGVGRNGEAVSAWSGAGDAEDFPTSPGTGFIPLSCHEGCGCPLHEMTSGRGHFPGGGSPDVVNNHEMAQQFSGAINATRVIVNRGSELGALSNAVMRYHTAVERELRDLRLHVAGRPITRARERLDALDNAHAAIPPEERTRSHPVLQGFVWATIAAIAAIESWFLYRVGLESLQIREGSWSGYLGWLLGPILAFLLYALGRFLSERLMRLRVARFSQERTPTDTGSPVPSHRRAGRGVVDALARRPGLVPLVLGVGAVIWLGYLFLMLAYYRAEGVLQVPSVTVMALLGTFAVGAVFLETMIHNPYSAARKRAQRDYDRARRECERYCDAVLEQVSRHRQAHSALRSRRDELLGIARTEVVRAWQSVNLPARFRHGMSSPRAPLTASPTDVLPDRPFSDRLSPEEVARYFRVFADVDTPAPDLAGLWEVGRVLDEYSPDRHAAELDGIIHWLGETARPADDTGLPKPREGAAQ